MDQNMQDEFKEAMEKYESHKQEQARLTSELEIKVPSIITVAKPPKEERSSKFSKTGGTSKMSADAASQKSDRSTNYQVDKPETVSLDMMHKQ